MYADTASSILKVESLKKKHPSLYSDQPILRGWNQQDQLDFSDDQSQNVLCVSDVFNFDWYEAHCPPAVPCRNTQMSFLELKDFDDIWGDFGWCDPNNQLLLDHVENGSIDTKALDAVGQLDQYHEKNNVPWVRGSEDTSETGADGVSWRGQEDLRPNGKAYKSSSLTLDEIQRFFDVPITKAAKELNVGLTVLKKRCRELNIARWPHRKIKSLTSLIHNVKELGLRNEIAMLEEHKRMLMELPEMELTEKAKKLRQACFKANYKKRKALAAPLS